VVAGGKVWRLQVDTVEAANQAVVENSHEGGGLDEGVRFLGRC
jgi:hypothetical protein